MIRSEWFAKDKWRAIDHETPEQVSKTLVNRIYHDICSANGHWAYAICLGLYSFESHPMSIHTMIKLPGIAIYLMHRRRVALQFSYLMVREKARF